MVNDTRIPFVLGSKNQKLNEPIEFEVTLTDEEKDEMKGLVKEFSPISVIETITGSQDCFVITLEIEADIDYIDSHDINRIDELIISNDAEITILPNDSENSDILPDKDGIYDLRPVILALVSSSIPNNYSEVESKEGEFHIYSVEEYEKEKAKKNSPFDALDALDLD